MTGDLSKINNIPVFGANLSRPERPEAGSVATSIGIFRLPIRIESSAEVTVSRTRNSEKSSILFCITFSKGKWSATRF